MATYDKRHFCQDCERRRGKNCLKYKTHFALAGMVCEWLDDFNPDDYKNVGAGNVTKGITRAERGKLRGVDFISASINI